MNPYPPDHPVQDESYWSGVRAQYAVSPDFINLENGFFGVQATPVHQAFQRYQEQLNLESAYFLRVRLPERLAGVMRALAAFTGADAGELVITRNLMESLNILLQGYPWRAGDEVLLAEHDYDSVIETLEMVAARHALTLTRLTPPLDPASDEQIVALYQAAITPRTRVLLLTHMVHRTGQIMPVAKIAAMARRHGVDVMVDAAHSFAQLDYRLGELGADFVGVNLHKWLGAPLGVGLLYIRRPRVVDIAPLFGDSRSAVDDIKKLAHVGTVPPAPILAIEDALAFHLAIGSARKEARLRHLSQYWMTRVRDVPGVRLFTPRAAERSCAIAAFGIEGVAAQQVVRRLMDDYRIFTVLRTVGAEECVRVTPHLFTSIEQLDALVAAIGEIAAGAR
ncbi:aminotransferase class V-fold PLP-dependent enzyme [Rugamonas sp. CCM 8940]|uniref:aminotransferase class V-fold PLP-dependent enzyme n=1 Tax=Rugamonas sp. CCM 8940 TaxID=2765359 RepID=UPI0018F50C3B|nr:aminotransferase class V-fold PLP-dependent enzyme [Rugamonas sp. CCM 8940]MBJ7313079.1 aminotransferase class V-fold PLP-dependent enzyme [Rugamonas sp. CCM 8940]